MTTTDAVASVMLPPDGQLVWIYNVMVGCGSRSRSHPV